MNSRERFEAIVKGDKPDRVSLGCQLSMGHIVKYSGYSPAEFYIKRNEVDTFIKLTDEYQFDGFCPEWPGVDEEYLRSQVDSIIDKPNGQLIIWNSGDQTFCPPDDYPVEIPRIKPEKRPITEIEAIDLITNEGYIKRFNDLPEYYMQPWRDALKKAGDTYAVMGFYVSPLSILIHVYGIQETLLALIDYPDVCKKLLEGLTEHCLIWIDNLADTGLPIIAITAPYEGMGFMSLKMYREFGVPYAKKTVEHVKKRGVYTFIHMCGYINDRLEELADLGVDGVECFDPPPIGNVDLEDAVKRIGSKVFIKGNIDPVNTLYKKSPDEIYEDAVKRIKIGYPTQRFILSTACSVSPNTPPENIKVLIRAVNDYGWY